VQVIVGRIGRAHGIKGEVGVEVRTDEPDRRFPDGGVLTTVSQPPRTLTITSTRWHSGRLLVRFEGVGDRGAAEQLRNLEVQAEVGEDERPEDPDEYYDRELIGLRVRTTDGEDAGEVTDVVHLPSQDLLEVRRPAGNAVLVPLVEELVPTIDLAGRYVVVADRPGLLDPEGAEVVPTIATSTATADDGPSADVGVRPFPDAADGVPTVGTVVGAESGTAADDAAPVAAAGGGASAAAGAGFAFGRGRGGSRPAMRLDVVSIFPEYLAALDVSLVGKAARTGLLDLRVHDLRDWTHDRHRTVDDSPYGGGAGMVMKPEPWAEALESLAPVGGPAQPRLIVPTPAGRPFSQRLAQELAAEPWLAFACGRYEGIDARVVDHAAERMQGRRDLGRGLRTQRWRGRRAGDGRGGGTAAAGRDRQS
jgi:16S rRNA processing protein RimM